MTEKNIIALLILITVYFVICLLDRLMFGIRFHDTEGKLKSFFIMCPVLHMIILLLFVFAKPNSTTKENYNTINTVNTIIQ